MKVTGKGQVTIPIALRRRYGLNPDAKVEFSPVEGGVLIRTARDRKEKFRAWLEKVRGSATTGITSDEIMRLTRGED